MFKKKKRRRKRKYTRRRKLFKFRLKTDTIYTIFSLILFAGAGLSMLAFQESSPLLKDVRQTLINYIGWEIYLLPLIFISFGLIFLRLKFSIAKPNVTAGLLITFVALSGLTKAGIIGTKLNVTIASFITGFGAFFLYTLLAVVGLIILFNTSLDKVILFLANFFDYIKNLFDNHIIGDLGNLLDKSGNTVAHAKGKMKISGAGEDSIKPGLVDASGKPIPETLEPAGSQLVHKSNGDDQTLSTTVLTNVSSAEIEKWKYPPLSLLDNSPGQKADSGDIKKNADIIEKTLESFGIKARVVEVNIGPAVTQYALDIALGTKLSKITTLSNDLALALAAPTGQIRIEAPIPGRSLVGIEVPNKTLEFVRLHNMLTSDLMLNEESKLSVALGLDVAGKPVIADIARMPHVLIAGTTGAGKSVLLNSWITSILYRTTPAEIRLILIDPKRVELTTFNGVPHLLTEVIVEPKQIVSALKWAVGEMERRYKEFARAGARNISSYNKQAGFHAMPNILIVIDELADLMSFAASEVEDSITRIAQMARATGIHLIIATQRPSVDVITGLMKANIPCRIAFNVSSSVDSRVIIDQTGADKLLGRGDMLYIPPDQAKPTRIQGVFVSDKEVKDLVGFLKNSEVEVEYTDEVVGEPIQVRSDGKVVSMSADDRDPLFDDALKTVCRHDKASSSLLQRRLSIGYARAARILDQLHSAGIVGPPEGSKPRDVLIKDPNIFYEQEQSKIVAGSG